MSTHDDLAALLAAQRAGVLITAPGIPDYQREWLQSEMARMRREVRALRGVTDVLELPPSGFTRKPDSTGGDRGTVAINIAAIVTQRDFDRLVYGDPNLTSGLALELLRDNARNLDDYVAKLIAALDPEMRAEVESLHERFRSGWPDEAIDRANKPMEARNKS